MRASVLAASLLAISGCSGSGTVVVEPATPAVVDTFFVTWEIQSAFYGPVDCAFVGAVAVDMDLVNVDTGERLVYSFSCDDYQGESGPLGVGTFDVLLNLTDSRGGVVSQVNLGAENVSTAGRIDLGHIVFDTP